MRWREELTCVLVKLYLKHENLWNFDHDFYRIKEKRQESFRNIRDELLTLTGVSLHELEIRVKIKNLRSTYTQELAKIRKRSNENYTYKPNMKWFADWHKCFNNLTKYKIDDSLFDADENSGNDEQSEDSDWAHLKTDNQESEVVITKPINYKNKKKKIKQELSNIEYLELNDNRLSFDDESTSKENEYDTFGKYITTQLKKMSTQTALRVKLQIHTLVSEARLSDMTEES